MNSANFIGWIAILSGLALLFKSLNILEYFIKISQRETPSNEGPALFSVPRLGDLTTGGWPLFFGVLVLASMVALGGGTGLLTPILLGFAVALLVHFQTLKLALVAGRPLQELGGQRDRELYLVAPVVNFLLSGAVLVLFGLALFLPKPGLALASSLFGSLLFFHWAMVGEWVDHFVLAPLLVGAWQGSTTAEKGGVILSLRNLLQQTVMIPVHVGWQSLLIFALFSLYLLPRGTGVLTGETLAPVLMLLLIFIFPGLVAFFRVGEEKGAFSPFAQGVWYLILNGVTMFFVIALFFPDKSSLFKFGGLEKPNLLFLNWVGLAGGAAVLGLFSRETSGIMRLNKPVVLPLGSAFYLAAASLYGGLAGLVIAGATVVQLFQFKLGELAVNAIRQLGAGVGESKGANGPAFVTGYQAQESVAGALQFFSALLMGGLLFHHLMHSLFGTLKFAYPHAIIGRYEQMVMLGLLLGWFFPRLILVAARYLRDALAGGEAELAKVGQDRLAADSVAIGFSWFGNSFVAEIFLPFGMALLTPLGLTTFFGWSCAGGFFIGLFLKAMDGVAFGELAMERFRPLYSVWFSSFALRHFFLIAAVAILLFSPLLFHPA